MNLAANPLKVLAIVACLPVLAGAATAGSCVPTTLEMRGDWGQARFSVEVADTQQKRALGLMHRRAMPSGAGMLFVYDKTGRVSFWMRNTLIELDMLFADAGGVIQHIHHRAQPLDETSIPGGDGIRYVLEINGGLAKAMGISTGTQMRHPSLLQENALWPC